MHQVIPGSETPGRALGARLRRFLIVDAIRNRLKTGSPAWLIGVASALVHESRPPL